MYYNIKKNINYALVIIHIHTYIYICLIQSAINIYFQVSYARPSGEDIKETNLYVTNLPRAITEDQLETIFGKYGRIVQKHILRDKSNGTPRGVAFVRLVLRPFNLQC